MIKTWGYIGGVYIEGVYIYMCILKRESLQIYSAFLSLSYHHHTKITTKICVDLTHNIHIYINTPRRRGP